MPDGLSCKQFQERCIRFYHDYEAYFLIGRIIVAQLIMYAVIIWIMIKTGN